VEQSRLYHFLPYGTASEEPSSREEAIGELARACELDEENPLYIFYEGVEKARDADAVVREKASSAANEILGSGSGGAGDEPSALEGALFSALLKDPEMAIQRRPKLEAAERSVREAIDKAPSTSIYHTFLADLIFEIGESTALPEGGESSTALWLAPNKPGALFHAGKVSLLSVLGKSRDTRGTSDLSFAFESFRSCISRDSLYTKKIYPLIMDTLGGNENLFAVTPDTVEGYEQLTLTLQEAGEWDAVLSSLDNMKRLCGLSGDSVLQNGSELLDIQMSVLQRRTKALEILGRYEERKEESRLYRTLLRMKTREKMQEAYLLRGTRHYSDAFAIVLEILEEDWANPDTLLLAADLAAMPGVVDQFSRHNTPLSHLFRLVALNDSLSHGMGKNALDVLEKLTQEKKEEGFLCDLVEGSVFVLSGKCLEGIAILDDIVPEAGKYREVNHLVEYFLGMAYESRGLSGEARNAYEKVLKKVPSHRHARERLGALDNEFSSDGPGDLEYITEMDFGGKVRLLGYSKEKMSDSAGRDCAAVRLRWELVGRDAESCRFRIQLLDEDMELISQEFKRLSGLRKEPLNIYYCGEMMDQEIKLNGGRSRAEYVKIWVKSENAGIQADNGEKYVVLKLNK